MKKFYFVLAVLATAALTSCVQEQSFNNHIFQEGDVAFFLQAGPSTKAAEAASPVRKGASIQIGEIGNQSIILEETITDLSYVIPATKGTPVFTENVGTLYKDNLGVYSSWDEFGEATYTTEGKNESTDESTNVTTVDGWSYFHRYDNAPWPANNGAVDFYMRMPADALTIPAENYDGGQIEFEYTSPATAAEQQDLIFAYASITEKQNKDAFSSGGVPVTFYHALTGVKFAIGNTAAELSSKGIAITGIKFTNLANTGTCYVTPSATSKVSWDASATEGNEISQTFDYSADGDAQVITFDQTNNTNNFGDSFFTGGTSQNVNNAKASYTFWLIPQSFPSTSTAVMRISYTMSGRNEYLDVSLKDFFGSHPWAAGQLRTVTIKLDEVNVMITDNVTKGANAVAGNGFSGTKKTNVQIKNTGDTPAFIRAAIVGQWLDSDGNPVFGFTDEINQLYIVESWYEDQFVKTTAGTHGTFVGLPGYKNSASFKADEGATADANGITPGWQLCTDGYYYYTKIVQPGEYTGSTLFTSYETLIAPETIIAGDHMDTESMHFVLEISTQAITAVKTDGFSGSRYTWKQAWANATGTEPVGKTNN